MSDRLSYTVAELVEATGISRSVIFEHIKANRLTPRYPTTRPVFTRAEVEAWLASLPTDLEDFKRQRAS